MTLREELEKIDARLGTAVEGLRSDVDSLKAALANVAVPEDVSDVLSSLDHKVSLLEGLDNETPEPQPEPTEPPVEGDNV